MQPKKHYFAHIPTIAIFIVFAMSAPLGVLLFILKSIDKNAEKEEKEYNVLKIFKRLEETAKDYAKDKSIEINLNLNSNVNLSKNGANSNTNLNLDEIKIQRQSLQNRAVHWGIALSTFLLIITGLFQLPISKRYMINELPLMAWSGDYHISLVAHYVGAVVFCAFIAFHLYFHIARREFDIFPKRGDFKKSTQVIKAMLTNGEEPPSEKYLPEQRLAYAFIGFTLLLLLVTGLIKTFKNLAGFNLSDSVYFWVAQLHNLGFVLIIFGIIGHLAAFIFKANRPLLSSMFSGKVSAKYILHRHTLSKDECERAEKAIKKAQKDKK